MVIVSKKNKIKPVMAIKLLYYFLIQFKPLLSALSINFKLMSVLWSNCYRNSPRTKMSTEVEKVMLHNLCINCISMYEPIRNLACVCVLYCFPKCVIPVKFSRFNSQSDSDFAFSSWVCRAPYNLYVVNYASVNFELIEQTTVTKLR